MTLKQVTALWTGLNIPYERESRHQIWHATVHLVNTVLVYKLHMCHLWDQWLHRVGTILVHIHNPVPCIMMLNISCIIMECPICMLQQHIWNILNSLFNRHRFNGFWILWTKFFATSPLFSSWYVVLPCNSLVDMSYMCTPPVVRGMSCISGT